MTRMRSNADQLYEILMSEIRRLPDDQQHTVRRAYPFSARAYNGQTRRSGEPAIDHPLRIAIILAELHVGSNLISAGLLHDVPNITDVRVHSIAYTFGYDVGGLVEAVSEVKPSAHLSEKAARIKTNEKLGHALLNDQRVAVLRVADKLDTLRHPHPLVQHDRKTAAREALRVEARLAKAIRMPGLALEIEQISYEILELTYCPSGIDMMAAAEALEQEQRDLYQSIVRAISTDKGDDDD